MVIATGTPEEVANNEASYTGQYLKPLLKWIKAANVAAFFNNNICQYVIIVLKRVKWKNNKIDRNLMKLS
jgi:hypothetical protein